MSDTDETASTPAARPRDFIRAKVAEDLAAGRYQQVVTRFPPEPNGFLHIGHAKAIAVDFQLAAENPGSRCHLRFDDTNPVPEYPRFVDAIQADIRWLGYDWGENLFHASDYFDKLYADAVRLIDMGKAYVCDLSEDEFREHRGTVAGPGKPSPYRDRSPEESKDLLTRMKAGEFEDGSRVLRAKIDMANPNMKMRDPPVYRIKHAEHYRTGDAWKIYPIYDYAHPLSDCYEGVTHSLCTLEFENNRELYDWYLDTLEYSPRPYQTEFARLKLNYMVMSKRKFLRLVEGDFVSGWDDPRMPTVAGLRRRGVTPEAIRAFVDSVGVAKANSVVDLAQFEFAIRDDLNYRAPRAMAILDPLKVVVTNYPEGKVEELDAACWPHDVPHEGSRKVPFDGELYIERSDFEVTPPKGFHRLTKGAEVRLRHAYYLRCDDFVQDENGRVTELRCSYDPESRGGETVDGRKVKGTIHWVSAKHAVDAEVRVYDRLFLHDNPDVGKGDDFLQHLNPDSLVVKKACKLEPWLAGSAPGEHYQFERQGYFVADSEDHASDRLVFNRVVPLKDSWSKKKAVPKAAAPSASAPVAPVVARDHAAELDGDAKVRFERFTGELKIGDEAARVLAEPGALGELFDSVVAAGGAPDVAANLVANALPRALNEAGLEAAPFGGVELAALVALEVAGTVTRRSTREVLAAMVAGEGDPAAIVEARGLAATTDLGELGAMVDAVMADNPDNVAKYRGGKTGLKGFFVGQVMKRSKGSADPKLVQQLLAEKLG